MEQFSSKFGVEASAKLGSFCIHFNWYRFLFIFFKYQYWSFLTAFEIYSRIQNTNFELFFLETLWWQWIFLFFEISLSCILLYIRFGSEICIFLVTYIIKVVRLNRSFFFIYPFLASMNFITFTCKRFGRKCGNNWLFTVIKAVAIKLEKKWKYIYTTIHPLHVQRLIMDGFSLPQLEMEGRKHKWHLVLWRK